MMHPSNQVEREYAVRLYGDVDEQMLKNLVHGVELEDGPARFEDIVESGGEGANRWFHVVIVEGRKREVRRLWESQGVTVSRLIRVRYDHVLLPPELRKGRWVEMEPEKVNELAERFDLPPQSYKEPEKRHRKIHRRARPGAGRSGAGRGKPGQGRGKPGRKPPRRRR